MIPPGTTAFKLGHGDVGCLLVHGFGGRPTEMLPLGEFLARQGFVVLGTQLAGHGTDQPNAYHTSWQNWLGGVELAYELLNKEVQSSFILGHSTGAILALLLAGRSIGNGVIAYSPISNLMPWQKTMITLGHKFIRSIPLPKYGSNITVDKKEAFELLSTKAMLELSKLLQAAPAEIAKVNVPVMIFSGGRDRAVPRDSAHRICEMLVKINPELVELPYADHMLMVSKGREVVWEKSLEFLNAHLR